MHTRNCLMTVSSIELSGIRPYPKPSGMPSGKITACRASPTSRCAFKLGWLVISQPDSVRVRGLLTVNITMAQDKPAPSQPQNIPHAWIETPLVESAKLSKIAGW